MTSSLWYLQSTAKKAGDAFFFECSLTPTAEIALVRAACNAQPSANAGRGQRPSPSYELWTVHEANSR